MFSDASKFLKKGGVMITDAYRIPQEYKEGVVHRDKWFADFRYVSVYEKTN